ncbi:MAG: proton-conducting transporter membrane subunit [Conexivisphaerales archaeon]
MTLFVITLTEILFTSSALCLALDFASQRLGRFRPYAIGTVASAAIVVSLSILLSDLNQYMGKLVTSRPFPSQYSTLYLSDNYTLFIILLVLVISLTVSVYSAFWLKADSKSGPFYALLLLLTCSLIGVASAGDFVTLFLFWEGMSLASYGLVSFRKTFDIALEASLKYFFVVGLGSLLALFGISLIYYQTGSLELGSLARLYSMSPITSLALIIIIIGFGAEAAIAPLHTWLPDVYSAASSPVAAMISGTVTAMGIFGPLKILQPIIASDISINFKLVVAVLGLATMLIGNFGALYQTNLRRMLGYSSIAQTGYILAALSTFSTLGLIASVFMIWNHGILKSNFFALTGSVEEGYQGGELARLRGIGRQSRLLGTLFTLSSLGMVGSPPFGLFWGELLVVESLVMKGGLYIALAAAVALNIVLSIGYYYRVINTVVFGEAQITASYSSKLLFVPVALLGLSLVTGIMPQLFLNLIS